MPPLMGKASSVKVSGIIITIYPLLVVLTTTTTISSSSTTTTTTTTTDHHRVLVLPAFGSYLFIPTRSPPLGYWCNSDIP